MDARKMESELDELMDFETLLTPERAKAIGSLREMLWEIQNIELASVGRNFRGISA